MALTPDKTRVEFGLTIHEKIIPWGAVWPRTVYDNSGKVRFSKGAKYKADQLLSGGTGKPAGVTIHNTEGSANAETYTRATWPNGNMNDVRVHYYVDDKEAWQNLKESEVGWHAADGNGPGNTTTIAIEIIMNGKAIADSAKAEDNGAKLAAILLHKYNLPISTMYPHQHWYKKKQCPLYILPHWDRFVEQVKKYLDELNGTQVSDPIPDQKLTCITGETMATAQQMRAFLERKNPQAIQAFRSLPEVYIAEGEKEGIRGDVAFAQSLVETGFFRFGGDVSPEQNNFCGLGATGNGAPGNSFPDAPTGIRAQIQHLKAYANDEPLNGACIDPRFKYVTRGCAPYVEWLGIPDNPKGKGWAAGKGYGAAILQLLEDMLKEIGVSSAPLQPPQEERAATLEEAAEILKKAGISSIKF